MSLSPNEAAQSLREATVIQKRSAEVYGYSLCAPYFFIWGLVWVAGYAGQALAPARTGWIWPGSVLAGILATVVAGKMQKMRPHWRVGAAFGLIFAFSCALFAVIPPRNDLQAGAYWPLLFAALYAGVGLWFGTRYMIVGAILAAAALGGYFFLPGIFFLWMALVGGGSLILTGFWLRRA